MEQKRDWRIYCAFHLSRESSLLPRPLIVLYTYAPYSNWAGIPRRPWNWLRRIYLFTIFFLAWVRVQCCPDCWEYLLSVRSGEGSTLGNPEASMSNSQGIQVLLVTEKEVSKKILEARQGMCGRALCANANPNKWKERHQYIKEAKEVAKKEIEALRAKKDEEYKKVEKMVCSFSRFSTGESCVTDNTLADHVNLVQRAKGSDSFRVSEVYWHRNSSIWKELQEQLQRYRR